MLFKSCPENFEKKLTPCQIKKKIFSVKKNYFENVLLKQLQAGLRNYIFVCDSLSLHVLINLLSKHSHVHWLCLKNERFNVSLRRISLIHKSTYVFVEFVILHSYHKKYANIFDHFKFKRDFFFCEISVFRGSANISDLGIHCHQKA